MLDETALDSFIDDLLAGRPTVGTDDPATEAIAGLARFGALSPPAAGQAKGRQMMVARARELKKTPVVSRWRQRLTAVIAAATAMTMLSGGAVYAASGSAPGDLLYPVKRAAENVSISFKPPGIARAQAEVNLARIRLAEIKLLVKRGETKRIGALVRELNGNLTAAGGWRSRLTAAERQRIETGAGGLRREIKNAVPARKMRRKATPKTIRKNPALGTVRPKSAPRTSQPEEAAPTIQPAPAMERPIDKVRPALPLPKKKLVNPTAHVKPARPWH